MPALDHETFGPLLHGAARAWRLKLDERLRPLGMSQSKWRTLLHLSTSVAPITQSELAARLGIEEPTLVNLLHRLEKAGWVKRETSVRDRRCKTVRLQRRARRVIAQIDTTARALRTELIRDVRPTELATCMRVLRSVRAKAEEASNHNLNGRRNVSTKHGR
ncbi:MAG: MarR family transcriptional regulator [Verrucomicrobiota bacterium]|nr:MarR family transcriptional regulator [Verrucomicrobiota bacterium]